MQAALLPHLADESVSSAIHRATAVFGASPHVHRCAVMGGETAGQDHGRGCVTGRSSWLLQHLQPSRCSFESCLRRSPCLGGASHTPSPNAMIHMAVESERRVNV